jgi:hypothetical protein
LYIFRYLTPFFIPAILEIRLYPSQDVSHLLHNQLSRRKRIPFVLQVVLPVRSVLLILPADKINIFHGRLVMETLAIDGGRPVRSKGPIVETDVFEQEELDALIQVAKDKKLRRAEAALEYERTIAEWFGVKHAIAVSSGSTALHIALAAFGIGPGDEVIVTPYTFVASDAAVLEQNAIPIFADVDPCHADPGPG